MSEAATKAVFFSSYTNGGMPDAQELEFDLLVLVLSSCVRKTRSANRGAPIGRLVLGFLWWVVCG